MAPLNFLVEPLLSPFHPVIRSSIPAGLLETPLAKLWALADAAILWINSAAPSLTRRLSACPRRCRLIGVLSLLLVPW